MKTMKRDLHTLISEMTLEEKASLCSGASFWYTKPIERLGIPSVMMTDGPHGLRKQSTNADHLGINDSVVAVCFPAACATASSFDPELMNQLGETLGNECQAEDISILLGPAVNIKRSPLCGRNFEYMSEDPYLTGQLAAAYINGVQSQHVGTSMKHFAANNQEYNRMSCSSEVSERALREIYLSGFEQAVKAAQPKTIMCSYNKLNGTYASENEWLLTKVLRDDWGFAGYVVTDWGAVSDRVNGIQAGLDLEMPASNGINDAKIVDAVKRGILDEKVLDRTVERLLQVLYSYVDNRNPNAVFDRDADHRIAVDMAAECAVLLENNGILPLQKNTKAAYIGSFAATPRYQGGGSSHINPSKVTSALETAQEKGRDVTFVPAFSAEKDALLEHGLEDAVAAAKAAQVAVIFAGLPDSFESEGYDRKHMDLPAAQNELIAAVAAVQPNTIVVLHNGSPVLCPWAEQVSAILEMYLGGQGVGEACDRLLWGEANPCGRLAETFPLRLQDTPCYLNFPGDGKKVHYAEDIYVGYRYYDSKEIPVRWAFGHGLSYTSFAYSNLTLSADTLDDTATLTVHVNITNTGAVAGKEVVQLYVHDLDHPINRPYKELKGFAKVFLQPGETKTVAMHLTARDLSYWSEELGDWYTPSGNYQILIGHASDEILLTETVHFVTKKLLPLVVSMSTTMGELLQDPRTAPVIQQMMAAANSTAAGNMLNSEDPSTRAMAEAMFFGLPLKALLSFGMAAPDQLDNLISALNQALGESASQHL